MTTTASPARTELDLAYEDLKDLEAEALESWRLYRSRILRARERVAELQLQEVAPRPPPFRAHRFIDKAGATLVT